MNIVLVVIDTARGDITNTMLTEGKLPHLEKLADEGSIFTEAYANGPWTVPSHASMFTGKYPSQAGIHGSSPGYDSVPLIEELSDRGFETAGFSANPWLNREFGFDESFDVFYNTFDYRLDGASVQELFGIREHPVAVGRTYLNKLRKGRYRDSVQNAMFWAYQRMFRRDSGGAYLLSHAGDWLSEGNLRFAFVNVTESHLQYALPEKWLPDGIDMTVLESVLQDTTLHNAGVEKITERDLKILRETYRATLRYTDDQIGKLVERANNDTIFVIVGDHGEHFGEYGRFGHQYSLYEELLHVPLLISGPGVESRQVTEIVELRSLYDFIIDLADGQVNAPEKVVYHIAEAISPTPSIDRLSQKTSGTLPQYVLQYGYGARCISKDGHTLVEFPDGEFELMGINGEEIDELHSILFNECGRLQTSRQSEFDVSQTTETRLNDLGYL